MPNDLFNDVEYRRAISPVSVSDNTAQVSQIIDTKGYSHLAFITAIGALDDADATFTPLLEAGDESDLSDAAAVSDDDMIGNETDSAFQFDDDNEVRKLAVPVKKRYYQLTITPAGNASGALLCVTAALAGAQYLPVDAQADD